LKGKYRKIWESGFWDSQKDSGKEIPNRFFIGNYKKAKDGFLQSGEFSSLKRHSRGQGFDPPQLHKIKQGVISQGLIPFFMGCMLIVWVIINPPNIKHEVNKRPTLLIIEEMRRGNWTSRYQ